MTDYNGDDTDEDTCYGDSGFPEPPADAIRPIREEIKALGAHLQQHPGTLPDSYRTDQELLYGFPYRDLVLDCPGPVDLYDLPTVRVFVSGTTTLNLRRRHGTLAGAPEVHVMQDATGVLEGADTVTARDSAVVHATHLAGVLAKDHATVYARGAADVFAQDYATVYARGHSEVHAIDEVSVHAGDYAKVVASDQVGVWLYEMATAEARGKVHVSASDLSLVDVLGPSVRVVRTPDAVCRVHVPAAEGNVAEFVTPLLDREGIDPYVLAWARHHGASAHRDGLGLVLVSSATVPPFGPDDELYPNRGSAILHLPWGVSSKDAALRYVGPIDAADLATNPLSGGHVPARFRASLIRRKGRR